MNGVDQVSPRQQRSAVAAKAERQRPRFSRKLHQAREIALHTRTINQNRPQDRERHAGGAQGVLGGKLGASIKVGRLRRVGFLQNPVGCRPALRADRRHEDQVLDAHGFCRACQFGGRQAIDPVIGLLGNLGSGMRDAGEMNHRVDVPE